ncbi:amidohydrolase family protein [Mucilaginibacter sp. BJC16-A38]|uniref:amidohydrolase family protein n=1 Tax=Mucilaginibacter phenanthrenivorans TaxID=1234842 RepID=UPI00215848FA|nr:amidohydrolase family protein [Mucilaginibacter phenanthrenivorans]MCR8558462.1 amidohydrolase family protein [Mucilaginibacter phenanthrenivorans]
MKSFKADYVYPVCADPIKNGIVTVDDFGKIIAVIDPATLPEPYNAPVEQLSGIICPGFVNAHCHLELSHLKEKVKERTGLVNFIIDIQKTRGADAAEVLDAAYKADSDMYENGIIAVGDISNTNSTIGIKTASKLYYHSFIETFGFLPGRATEVFENALHLLNEFKPLPSSITPHAPYSVSKELFKLISKYSDTGHNLLSMHNQECEDENKFYRYKLGSFNDLYAHFGMDITFFKPQARNSLQSILPLLSSKQEILLVHNTCTNLKDIYFVKRFDRKIHFCFCPNANLHIEGILPKIELFIGQGYNITLGTDSLASNSKLCILSEMRTIQAKFPAISTQQLIQWGTLNGANFLGIDDERGSIEIGKTPGLNLISGLDGLKITPETKVKKLI